MQATNKDTRVLCTVKYSATHTSIGGYSGIQREEDAIHSTSSHIKISIRPRERKGKTNTHIVI